VEGIGWNMVWAVPLAPDQDMLPDENSIGILPKRSLTTHDRSRITSFFPSLHTKIEVMFSSQLENNLLLQAHHAVQQRHKVKKQSFYYFRLHRCGKYSPPIALELTA
jgi:hypothetical protein